MHLLIMNSSPLEPNVHFLWHFCEIYWALVILRIEAEYVDDNRFGDMDFG